MSLQHEEIEALLGAYALDAVEPDEAREIEIHLATCPRCRAEVNAYRDVAAVLGNSGAEAPQYLWERIAVRLGNADDVPAPAALIASLPHPNRRRRLILPALVAAAVVAVTVLSLQIAHLDHQVHHLEGIPTSQALAPAVDSALDAPHSTITLMSSTKSEGGTVIVTPSGTAYWIASSLQRVADSRTYQLWGLVDGRVVSLGLLGDDPSRYSAFRLEHGTVKLMVTIEPEGGTAAPTTQVIAAGNVPNVA